MFTEKDYEVLGAAAGNFGNSYAVLKDDLLEPELLEAIFQDVQGLKSEVRPAKMSRGEQEWADEFSSIIILI